MIHCRGTDINRYLAKFVGVMLVEFNPVHTPGGGGYYVVRWTGICAAQMGNFFATIP